jgi:hypothetical protein
LNTVSLNNGKDIAVWKWTKSKKFTVKSVYEFLIRDDDGNPYNRVWRATVPKEKKIMWFD